MACCFRFVLALALVLALKESDCCETTEPILLKIIETMQLHRVRFVVDLNISLSGFKKFMEQSQSTVGSSWSGSLTPLQPNEDVVTLGLDDESLMTVLDQAAKLGPIGTWIVTRNTNDSDTSGYVSDIDQEIYTYDCDRKTLVERYRVNDFIVENVISSMKGDKLVWTSQSVLERRSDLHGRHFKAVTSPQVPYVLEFPFATGPATYQGESGDEYYDIKPTGVHTKGMLIDILLDLEREMNFTTNLYRRLDHAWGRIDRNGSWTGMVRSLLTKDMEFAPVSFTINSARKTAVHFLHPLGTETFAFFIKQNPVEELSWISYFLPFRLILWMAILGLGILFSLIWFAMSTDWMASMPSTLVNVIVSIWQMAMVFVGRVPRGTTERAMTYSSVRWLIFLIIFCGNFVFMTYRASLTSELSVRRHKLPFDSVESYIASDYIHSAAPGFAEPYIFYPLLNNYEDPRGIIDMLLSDRTKRFRKSSDALDDLLKNPRRMHFSFYESVMALEEYQCEVKVAWKSEFPSFLSFGFPQDSPFYKLFNFRVLKFLESGRVNLLKQHWMARDLDCKSRNEQALSMEKLISLFAILAFGMGLAVLLFCLEWSASLGKRQSSVSDNAFEMKNGTNGQDNGWDRSTLNLFLMKWSIPNRQDFIRDLNELVHHHSTSH